MAKRTTTRKSKSPKPAVRKKAGKKTATKRAGKGAPAKGSKVLRANSSTARRTPATAKSKPASKPASRSPSKPKLLSGGNPQIAKADGDEAVQAYIAAMPGWKQEVGRRLDALVVRTVSNVRKAVRWNSPFYGTEQNGWFLGVHCITRYVKLAFFNGSSLKPLPPVESKHQDTRYFHIHEGEWGGGAGVEKIDEEQLTDWIRQASQQPGWKGFSC